MATRLTSDIVRKRIDAYNDELALPTVVGTITLYSDAGGYAIEQIVSTGYAVTRLSEKGTLREVANFVEGLRAVKTVNKNIARYGGK